MRAPLVSVVLPVRNAAATLREAIDSIRAQTLAEWEAVVVDDGSTDDSPEILARLSREDPRIRVLSLPPSGIARALEAARSRCRAPLLARMDADDRAHPERLAIQVAFLAAHPDLALCGTHVRYFPRALVRGGARRYEAWLNGFAAPEDLLRDLWVECPLAHPSLAMRAADLEGVGGYRDVGWPEDYDLLLRLWEAGRGFGVVPRVLHYWREGDTRLSRTDARYAPEAFRRIKLHFLLRTLLRGRDGLLIWGAGPVGKAFARDALDLAIPVLAFVELDPRKVGQDIHGAPVVGPDHLGSFRKAFGLGAVGKAGARDQIRDAFRRAGWAEGRDFVAVA
jgi:glycosyltransferase involved in cell wall biosynthesis